MEFSLKESAAIWRELIPARDWLCPEDTPEDELIFAYRDKIYFVNFDGSVLAISRPPHLELFNISMLYDRLASTEEVIDFDDEGIFDCGSILKQMGYVVPTTTKLEKHTYQIEIINTIAPQTFVSRYELKKVSYRYALYHAVMKCHELNEKSDWEFEHEVKQIRKIDPPAKKELASKSL